ncbi:hypothetical protein [Telmatospirillum sp. J64-1]|uniref:hypothetical protein n=1 Tax=Telmatospirillum sp. J64-1 TaxID=2502183 RepID=UPI002105C320|nr:hypothetical protein [Telmatospirillum sp. J64-1]
MAAVLFALLPGSGQAAAFLEAVEDIPLMPGLAEQTEAGLSFDTATGRIVEAYAHGDVSATDVASFYTAALPELGWQQITGLSFRREGEMLRLDVTGQGPVTVRFTLSPQ